MARNIPLIRSALFKDADVRIYIKSGEKQIAFARNALEELGETERERLRLIIQPMDAGLKLLPGTLLIDGAELKRCVSAYVKSWPEAIRAEKQFLKEQEISLAVCDIPAWTLAACREAGVRSLFISNFTWVEIYREYLEESLTEAYLDCYGMADEAFLYELYPPQLPGYFRRWEKAGFVCRSFHPAEADKIRSGHQRPCIYVGVGRSADIGEDIDVSSIPYDFFVTDGVHLTGDNVYPLDQDLPNTQDYILASDFVITKAGWGTIAEAVLAGKPMALLSRDTVAEDRNSIRQLVLRNLGIEADSLDLAEMGPLIKRLQSLAAKQRPAYRPDTERLAAAILRRAEAGSGKTAGYEYVQRERGEENNAAGSL